MPYAALELTPEIFIEFAKVCHNGVAHQLRVIKNGLPDDCRVVRVRLSRRDNGNLELILSSDTFDDVPEKADVPLLNPPLFEVVY